MLIAHVTAAGLVIAGADYLRIAEQPRPMAPFVAPSPFLHAGAGSWAQYEDWTVVYPAPPASPSNEQPWPAPVWRSAWVGVLFIDPQASATIRMKPGTPTARIRVMRLGEQPEMREIFGYTYQPCDINFDGQGNILDLMDFLGNAYDYTGDGTIDAADFLALAQACQGA